MKIYENRPWEIGPPNGPLATSDAKWTQLLRQTFGHPSAEMCRNLPDRRGSGPRELNQHTPRLEIATPPNYNQWFCLKWQPLSTIINGFACNGYPLSTFLSAAQRGLGRWRRPRQAPSKQSHPQSRSSGGRPSMCLLEPTTNPATHGPRPHHHGERESRAREGGGEGGEGRQGGKGEGERGREEGKERSGAERGRERKSGGGEGEISHVNCAQNDQTTALKTQLFYTIRSLRPSFGQSFGHFSRRTFAKINVVASQIASFGLASARASAASARAGFLPEIQQSFVYTGRLEEKCWGVF